MQTPIQRVESTPLLKPAVHLAADGFPIDQSLQRRARRAAMGYGLLALYYLCMTPFVLKFVRWGSLQHIAEDLLNRAHVLLPFVAHIAVTILLAICAWHVCSRTRLGSWAIVAFAGVVTLVTCGRLGWGLWRGLMGPASAFVPWSTIALSTALIAAYVVSFIALLRPVSELNAQRRRAQDQLEGRISA